MNAVRSCARLLVVLATAATAACATAKRPDEARATPRPPTRAIAIATADPGFSPVPGSGSGTVIIDLVGLEHARGQVLVALFRTPRGFPERATGAFASAVRKAQAGSLRIVFDAVPPGPFAVAVHHDEDADFAMDTGPFGVPEEGYGFSRDARAPFGPPDFQDASITLAHDEQRRIRIHMRYGARAIASDRGARP